MTNQHLIMCKLPLISPSDSIHRYCQLVANIHVAMLASRMMLPLHTQRRSSAERDESDFADTELPHVQSASADTKVRVYKICHESEKRSEGVDWILLTSDSPAVDWIHLTSDSPVVDSLGIRQWSCGFQKRRRISRPSDHKLIRNDCSM